MQPEREPGVQTILRRPTSMGFHHVALATRDLAATHHFYTEAMGFKLVKLVAAPTPEGGWAKHVFYDTGNGEMIAFWELHVDAIGKDFDADLNRAVGLPSWVNHLAFAAASPDELDSRRARWQTHGHDVVELDHEWCRSIYATDPNGITVEWCCTIRPFTAAEVSAAADEALAKSPALEATPPRLTPPEPR